MSFHARFVIRRILRTVKAKVKKLKKHGFRRIIQGHHITYTPIEWIVPVYKGEHWILSQLQRRTHVSKGFVTSLKKWMEDNERRAVELGPETKRKATAK